MKVFITGATGVIGRRAVPLLLKAGHEVGAAVHSAEHSPPLAQLGARPQDPRRWLRRPIVFTPLPFPAALYAALVFPLIWGFTEEMTYNGYLAPRIQVVSGRTAIAVALVALSWSLQHVVMPVTFDPDYMLYRMISPIPFSVFIILMYLRIRRLMPFAIAHWLMDGGDAFEGSLWPLLR